MLGAIGLGELLWSLLVLYVIVHILIATVIVVLDVVRSDDLSGARKALWMLTLLVFPLITVLVYLVTRGDGIGARGQARNAAPVGPPTAMASELRVAQGLLADGSITQAEYDQLKQRVLA
jgi:hypothetical protein